MQEGMTELASKARLKASKAKIAITKNAQTVATTAMDAAKRGAETANEVLKREDVRDGISKGIEIGKEGAEVLKKATIWAASIDSVKRTVGGAVVGAIVFAFVASMIPVVSIFLGAKIGLIVGAVLGFLRK